MQKPAPLSLFNPNSGAFEWSVDQSGYEIVPFPKRRQVAHLDTQAGFYRSPIEEELLRRRGVIRRKGGSDRFYRPMTEKPALARRLASLHAPDPLADNPSNEAILAYAAEFGLLGNSEEEAVADWVYAVKYLGSFAVAIDRGDKMLARKIFNERVMPLMTVRLIGGKDGRPTANWSMTIAPTNLIGAAWLQIAAELTTGARMQKCQAPDCSNWFKFRANKLFCNNRCRTSAHRHAKG
jgi:hypothetical protein